MLGQMLAVDAARSHLEPPMKKISVSLMLCIFAGFESRSDPEPSTGGPKGTTNMRLGNFSVSLAVKDLAASRRARHPANPHQPRPCVATKADESTMGPASLVLYDPDGNQILIDQHVPSPRK